MFSFLLYRPESATLRLSVCPSISLYFGQRDVLAKQIFMIIQIQAMAVNQAFWLATQEGGWRDGWRKYPTCLKERFPYEAAALQ